MAAAAASAPRAPTAAAAGLSPESLRLEAGDTWDDAEGAGVVHSNMSAAKGVTVAVPGVAPGVVESTAPAQRRVAGKVDKSELLPPPPVKAGIAEAEDFAKPGGGRGSAAAALLGVVGAAICATAPSHFPPRPRQPRPRARLSCGRWQNSQEDPLRHRPFTKKQHWLQVPATCKADPIDGRSCPTSAVCGGSSAGSTRAVSAAATSALGVASADDFVSSSPEGGGDSAGSFAAAASSFAAAGSFTIAAGSLTAVVAAARTLASMALLASALPVSKFGSCIMPAAHAKRECTLSIPPAAFSNVGNGRSQPSAFDGEVVCPSFSFSADASVQPPAAETLMAGRSATLLARQRHARGVARNMAKNLGA
mmetsp:Transcript_123269/g.356151  ORF Transcript_123269/g.356151 Transcript_123269/m.356151 type:complete len:365 (+) Transcript_123269:536-1630(+)